MLIFGYEIILPCNYDWLMKDDLGTHFLGWNFFKNESWHFPLGLIEKYGTESISVGYTDSIPLLALLFKPFSGLLPENFQYFGLWIFSCFVLQGVFASLLLRTQTENGLLQVFGAFFFVISPILIIRTGHPALCAHWIILSALWFYFRENRMTKPASVYFMRWLLLIGVSALVHPYLTAMITPVALAFYAREYIINKVIRFNTLISHFAGLGICILLLWWAVGYFGFDNFSHYGAKGFGDWSMNLLSPVNPNVGIDKWPENWSLIFNGWELYSPTQCDGFNYLGTGILILGGFAIITLYRRRTFSTLLPMIPLLCVCFLMVTFALSNKIAIGDTIAFQYSLPKPLIIFASIFHSSGRFFWPVNYLITYCILGGIINGYPVKAALGLMIVCLVLQMIDSTSAYYRAHSLLNEITWENQLNDEFWGSIEKYKHIVLVPPIRSKWPYLSFAFLASKHNLSINTSYVARFNPDKIGEYRSNLFNNVKNELFKKDSLYVFNKESMESLLSPKVRHQLKIIDGYYVLVPESG